MLEKTLLLFNQNTEIVLRGKNIFFGCIIWELFTPSGNEHIKSLYEKIKNNCIKDIFVIDNSIYIDLYDF